MLLFNFQLADDSLWRTRASSLGIERRASGVVIGVGLHFFYYPSIIMILNFQLADDSLWRTRASSLGVERRASGVNFEVYSLNMFILS